MGTNDWYRNRDWNAEIEAAFEAKFARTRQPWSRWQYLTIQAGMIAREHRDVALALLRRSIELKGVEPGWVSRSYHRMGELVMDDDRHAALEFLRKSIQACAPTDRRISGPKTPEEQLVLLRWNDGDEGRAEAIRHLRELDEVPDWGEIPDVPADPGGYTYKSPDDAAESLVVAFHATDRLSADEVDALFRAQPAVLDAFDRMMLRNTLFGVFQPWSDHGRWELPGFIGRCLVKNSEARWVQADHIYESQIDGLGAPFQLYPTVWLELARGVPIRGIFERLRGRKAERA